MPPSDVHLRAVNETSLMIQWRRPHERDLNGDLKGYKAIVDVSSEGATGDGSSMNFTLEPSVHSLVLTNVSREDTYTVRIGAYNRQACLYYILVLFTFRHFFFGYIHFLFSTLHSAPL